MIEFLPWSKKLLLDAFNDYKNTKRLQILDIELGGACNFNCLYCDTPKYGHNIKYKVEDLEKYLKNYFIHFVYICGLGEPTYGFNKSNLIEVLELCNKYNTKCCMFTNLSELDDVLFKYIDTGILYPIFKLDSIEVEKIKNIYNTNDELAIKQINNIMNISKHVNICNGYTNIAASIVPSSLNISEIKSLIDWCKEKKIFPLIGQLEDAGKGHDSFNSLNVNESLLIDLKKHITDCYGEAYSIPICPSVLFGIHIDFEGDIVVDKITGLSCHWFWLSEPQIMKLGKFSGETLENISEKIIKYRNTNSSMVKNINQNQKELVFGGCGGDIKYLLTFYINNML